ncbi:putative drug exporter of the RND superfamily [Bhargavaea ginsengi]|uniref:Putative drug exporter of the RND superfamily n=1 Tax=Bhargavaea ginsengi TaxID=426757 RepID=A0A1H6VLK8_9BACL|nr:MMPL family transporter [Bhargavaea ginsengi]SEJ01045.1 putative drug exporter of the RND superfamily [Bhargavaea ginsengi]
MKGKRKYWATLLIWIIAASVLSVVAPGARDFFEPNENSGLPADEPSIVASERINDYFPSEEGVPAIVVAENADGLTEEQITAFAEAIGGLSENESYEDVTVIPAQALLGTRDTFLSEDGTVFFAPVTLPGLEGTELKVLLDDMKETVAAEAGDGMEIYWTGPAGIAADAVELFSRADVVLILSTVAIILVLLLIIYRSPLLALIPLIGASIVYTVVDKVVGLGASAGWYVTENQSISIMLVLLFAVVTDYSLLVFSRFREELRTHEDTAEAMDAAVKGVREPIFFSGSTIFLGVLTLFVALYESYRNFAPVFAIAAAIILIAGLTLLPALFAIAGRKAFWPRIPAYGEEKAKKKTIWARLSEKVTARPVAFLIPVLAVLVLASINTVNYKESFDLIKSFPDDLSSRQGFEVLGDTFGEGELAPGTVLVVSEGTITPDQAAELATAIEQEPGIAGTSFQGMPVSEDGEAVQVTVTFDSNPYESDALDAANQLRDRGMEIAEEAGINAAEFHLAGQSAINADLREINDRDTLIIMIAVAVLITLMLAFQTRSVIAPLYLIGTLLLSFAATLGLSIFLFDVFFGTDEISYRIPLYTFVFLIALGVDYSIMLIARIREERKHHELKEAVKLGIEKTGGVISSAGLILAATFLVLGTMPIYELKLFGIMMALGILIDTFVVRPLLIPAIILLLGKRSGI